MLTSSLKSVGSDESDDSLVSIVRGGVVVDGVSCGWDSVGSEITVGNGRVELLGRIDLGHVGTERSDLTVGCAEWGVIVSGNNKDGLGEGSSVHSGGGSDGVCD